MNYSYFHSISRAQKKVVTKKNTPGNFSFTYQEKEYEVVKYKTLEAFMKQVLGVCDMPKEEIVELHKKSLETV